MQFHKFVKDVLHIILCLLFNLQGKRCHAEESDCSSGVRRLLSRSEFPPVEAALKTGAVPVLVQCPSFGSPDEQVPILSC
ncbi:Importin subunit alpha [Quillaja saponaria]|uniref:Importin subunit alpha n=1 Tax=Quillaja saponaria TaxID=32244 RepID=A0AAD7Q953_QUISA|nr:Importin subunit alpha [Quillaja saponaria]